MRCFNLFIREQTRLMVPSPPWAKKMGKKELLANALYRPAKSPEEKNWGKCPFPEDYFAFFMKWKFSSGFHSSKSTVLLQNQVKYNVFQYS